MFHDPPDCLAHAGVLRLAVGRARGRPLVELGGVAAEGRGFLDQDDVSAGFRRLQSGRHARDPASDDEDAPREVLGEVGAGASVFCIRTRLIRR